MRKTVCTKSARWHAATAVSIIFRWKILRNMKTFALKIRMYFEIYYASYLSPQSHKNISVKRLTYSCYLFFFDDFILDEKDSVNLFTVHFFSHFDWLLYLTELWLVCLFGMTETCYSCDFVHDQRMCNTTTVCGQGEVSFSLITLRLYYDLANYLT